MILRTLRIVAMFAIVFLLMSLDSLPTWALIVVAFTLALAFIYELVGMEDRLNDTRDLPDTDTPIADQVAADLAFDRDFNKEL